MITDNILEYLQKNPGSTIRQIAMGIKGDRNQINHALLYSQIRTKVEQDNKYRWWINEHLQREKHVNDNETSFKNTPLAKLCRYYLSCLGQDDVSEISVWARSKHDYDYAELDEVPLDGVDSLFSDGAAASLLRKTQQDRGSSQVYLGYPICLDRFVSSKGNDIYRLEPVFLIPIQFERTNNRGKPSLASDFPLINTSVLKRYSNVDNDTLMDELLQLEDELGFSSVAGDIPELDEVAQRLYKIRNDWVWQEACDGSALPSHPKINTLDEPGIYNRAVLLTAERKPFTQGLEYELRELANLDESKYRDTALGHFVENAFPRAGKAEKQAPLVEVLPMNLEQKEAVRSALEEPLTIITGPPGTGKSQVVTNLLVNAAWQKKKVLFASKNNKAVDVVETRVNNMGPRPVLMRLGSNAYQQRLCDSLHALLASKAGRDEIEEYQYTLHRHQIFVQQMENNTNAMDAFVALRNEVDSLERSIEHLRTKFDDSLFRIGKEADITEFINQFVPLRSAVDAIDKSQFSLGQKLVWISTKSAKFKRLNQAVQEMEEALRRLKVIPPTQPADVHTAGLYLDFIHTTEKRLHELEDIANYFSGLKALQNGDSLETLNTNHRLLSEAIADNSQKLWANWLKVSPSDLTRQDRQLLTQYASVVQMVVEAGNKRLTKSIWRQYYSLNEKVSHLLPCWAVTSLSTRGKIPFTAGSFDIVVFDEASQCDIASALPLLYRAKRAVVIGDPQQLSHISSIQKGQDQKLLERFDLVEDYIQWAYSWNSLYGMAQSYAGSEDIVNLRDHHRSHADIINFSNEFFYESRLRVATHYDRLRRPRGEPGVRWLDVCGETNRPQGGSAVNQVEAKAVVAELERLVMQQGYKGQIGVVSPFRAQANRIKELCNQNKPLQQALDNADFLSDTVHRFQGDEKDLIIFSPVISNGVLSQTLGFLRRNGNLFNVAITRARAMLLVVGDQSVASNCGVEYLEAFARYVDNLQQKNPDHHEEHEFGANYPSTVDRSKISDWEILFYEKLYKAGMRTIPQYPIEQYILDLALISGDRRLNIEIDGERYHRNWTGELCRRDQIRNQRMYELGWDVMRFWVYEIRDDLDNCVARVKEWLESAGE